MCVGDRVRLYALSTLYWYLPSHTSPTHQPHTPAPHTSPTHQPLLLHNNMRITAQPVLLNCCRLCRMLRVWAKRSSGHYWPTICHGMGGRPVSQHCSPHHTMFTHTHCLASLPMSFPGQCSAVVYSSESRKIFVALTNGQIYVSTLLLLSLCHSLSLSVTYCHSIPCALTQRSC